MKRKKVPAKNRSQECVPVHLEYEDGAANKVCIAGSFNDWHPDATPMVAMGSGRWVKELTLPPGRYEYRLVVDGEWKTHPTAGDTIPNPFGTLNSVLVVVAGSIGSP